MREWAQLLVERGRQLLARADREPLREALPSDRAGRHGEPARRRRSR